MDALKQEALRTTELVKRNVIGRRQTVIDGIPVAYEIYKVPGKEQYEGSYHLEDCWVDLEGRTYVPEIPGGHRGPIPEEYRVRFRDLIALHEKVEFSLLREQGLPAPRYLLPIELWDASHNAHEKAIEAELKAAKNMGILEEWIRYFRGEALPGLIEKLRSEK